MQHNIDWTKTHNGLMLCSYEESCTLMPEVKPIIDELIDSGMLEAHIDEYLIDVKVHMLMPDQFPCIPNWHLDFMPRDENGLRCPGKATGEKMYMWISGAPLTLYKDKDKVEYTKPAQQWHPFTQHDLHRGQAAEEFTWRGFIRLIPKHFAHKATINTGQIRKHTQVYLDASNFRW